MKTRSSWTTAFIYFASAVVVVLSVYPFVYAISTSLKTGTALFNTQIIPDQADLRNYYALFEGVQPFGKSLVNSVMVAVLTVGFAMLMGVTAAYALGRIRFKGKGLLLVCILGVSMFPQVAVLSGMFELIQWLGIYNKAWGLVFALHHLYLALHGLDFDHVHARAARRIGRSRHHGWLWALAHYFSSVHAAALASLGIDWFVGFHRRLE